MSINSLGSKTYSAIKWVAIPFVSLSLPFVVLGLIQLHIVNNYASTSYGKFVSEYFFRIWFLGTLVFGILIAFIMILSQLKERRMNVRIRKLVKDREIVFASYGLYLSTIDFDPENWTLRKSAYRYIKWESIRQWVVTSVHTDGFLRRETFLIYFMDGKKHELMRWPFADKEREFLSKLNTFIPGRVEHVNP